MARKSNNLLFSNLEEPMSSASDDSMRAVKMECTSSANVRKTSMSRVRDCFIIMTLAGLTFGLATKAVSQGDTQRSRGEWPQFNGGYDAPPLFSLSQNKTNKHRSPPAAGRAQ